MCKEPFGVRQGSVARHLAERIWGARQAIIQGAGHFVFVEKAEEVNQVIEEFLESLGQWDMQKNYVD